jgi:hypothetical protein
MTRKRILLMAMALCCAAARPLAAQAADGTGLERAVATVLADSLFKGERGEEPRVWVHSGIPLDSAVARIISRDARLNFRERGSELSLYIGIPRASVTADSAHVLVSYRQRVSLTGDLDSYMEENEYVFARDAARWRYVRRVFVRHADGGRVRGR